MGGGAQIDVDVDVVNDHKFIASGTCRTRPFGVIVPSRSSQDNILISTGTRWANFLRGRAFWGRRSDNDKLVATRTCATPLLLRRARRTRFCGCRRRCNDILNSVSTGETFRRCVRGTNIYTQSWSGRAIDPFDDRNRFWNRTNIHRHL